MKEKIINQKDFLIFGVKIILNVKVKAIEKISQLEIILIKLDHN